ncbi:MAG TPA: hypothetical protein QGF70_02140 [Candidatus Thalassarchaeaceae archaeon]|jgi:hypothetical protein|nr:hypothetical protein [Candidatus Thalassarchaeaceae archaeon]
MQPEESQAAEGFANQQVMMTESKSSLPVVVGILYAIYQILPILGGLALLLGGALIGGLGAETGDDDTTGFGAVMAILGVVMLIAAGVGIWAGVLMAKRKKLGIHVAWGLIGLGAVLSILTSIMGDMPIDVFTLGCNGVCALFVGLPLMVASASQHME